MPQTLPQNLEAEQTILGCALLEPKSIRRVGDLLPTDFYRESHALIWDAVCHLDDTGITVDIISLTDELRRREQLVKIGGATYLSSLVSGVMSAANIAGYAKIVQECAWRRRIISDAQALAAHAHDYSVDTESLSEKIQKVMVAADMHRGNCGYAKIDQTIRKVVTNIESVYLTKKSSDGIPTGLKDLDRVLCGLGNAECIVVAGRPSMGKSQMALNVIRHHAEDLKLPTALFSLEESKEQVALRLITLRTKIATDRFRSGAISEAEFAQFMSASSAVASLPLYIDDRRGLTVHQVRSAARRLVLEHGVKSIWVDYLQKLRPSRRDTRRDLEISEFVNGLFDVAGELQVPVIALSQLNREVEKRQDKRPMMSDLRDGGSIEEVADVILFLYRDEYYNPQTKEPGIMEVLIDKHRQGQTGFVKLGCNVKLVHVFDLARHTTEDRWIEV